MSIAPKLTPLALLALVWLVLPGRAGETDGDLPDVPIGKAKLLIVEDFESTPVGEVPGGCTKTGAVGVVDDLAHSGKKSLRMDPAVNGPRRITVKGDFLAKLGGTFWGRLYFKVKLPTPTPQGEGKFPVIHSTLVAGSAISPLANDPIEVRMLDTVMGPKGTFQYIYNVQPRKRPEFGKGSKYNYKYTDDWTLAEWYVDSATQTYRLFINGEEIKDVSFSKGKGNYDKAEIPNVFQSLSFGWNNYQKAGDGFTAWIDDIALSKDRIGDRGLPKAVKKK
ncbi:MAG TPA: hypothetical protein VFE47_10915 [Tepidisphaeraceae bacterium]|jgi:hypothetical protein|nr:hypothetical protein [Tepidisphaeraceae bacterium]